jgi:thioesterase domain-containing protein
VTRPASEPIARELRRRGLAVPALLLLDAHRPLQPLLGLAATFLLPIARPLLGRSAGRIQQALDEEAVYDDLMRELREESEG